MFFPKLQYSTLKGLGQISSQVNHQILNYRYLNYLWYVGTSITTYVEHQQRYQV